MDDATDVQDVRRFYGEYWETNQGGAESALEGGKVSVFLLLAPSAVRGEGALFGHDRKMDDRKMGREGRAPHVRVALGWDRYHRLVLGRFHHQWIACDPSP